MSEPIIDSDQIETMLIRVFREVTGEPTEANLETVKIQENSCFLQWRIRVKSRRLTLEHKLGVLMNFEIFTCSEFSMERLANTFAASAADVKVKLLAAVTELN